MPTWSKRRCPITLEEFTNLSVHQLQANLENVMELKINDTKVGALPAKSISYKATIPHLNEKMRTFQTWFIKNNKAYMLSCGAGACFYATSEPSAPHPLSPSPFVAITT